METQNIPSWVSKSHWFQWTSKILHYAANLFFFFAEKVICVSEQKDDSSVLEKRSDHVKCLLCLADRLLDFKLCVFKESEIEILKIKSMQGPM